MAEASWRAIAEALASRMENHDFCVDHGVIDEGVEEGCPFCLDRATMRTYRDKAGTVRRRAIGHSVAIHEIGRQGNG